MSLAGLGALLQGIGAILLALVTLLVGLRAAKALSIRVEGPIHVSDVRPPRRLKRGLEE